MDNKEKFLKLIEPYLFLNIGVEIGVWSGENVKRLLDRFHNLKVVCVDPYICNNEYDNDNPLCHCNSQQEYDSLYLATKGYFDRKYLNRTTWIRESSEKASHFVEPYSCDYVFIDGNHTFLAVITDILYWKMKVRHGGLLIGHDLNRERNGEFPVRLAVESQFGKDYKTIDDEYWYIEVR